MFRKIAKFCKNVVKVAARKIKNFIRGTYQHIEAITVLTLAALGLNALLGELPFIFMLPMWVEATLVIPVASVMIIFLLMKFAEWRSIRRDHRMVLA